jgi:hypothetical protein
VDTAGLSGTFRACALEGVAVALELSVRYGSRLSSGPSARFFLSSDFSSCTEFCRLARPRLAGGSAVLRLCIPTEALLEERLSRGEGSRCELVSLPWSLAVLLIPPAGRFTPDSVFTNLFCSPAAKLPSFSPRATVFCTELSELTVVRVPPEEPVVTLWT